MTPLTTARCRTSAVPASQYADQVEGIYEAGGYVKTDGWSIKSIDVSQAGTMGA